MAIVGTQDAHSEYFDVIIGYVQVLKSADGIIWMCVLVTMVGIILQAAPCYFKIIGWCAVRETLEKDGNNRS